LAALSKPVSDEQLRSALTSMFARSNATATDHSQLRLTACRRPNWRRAVVWTPVDRLAPEQARRLNKRSERERISGLQMQHREKDDTAYGKTLSQQQEGHRPIGSSSLL
jgi:hypothetical protein